MRRTRGGRTDRGSITTGLLIGLALLGAGAAGAAAQSCQPEWRSWGGAPGIDGPGVQAVTVWDPDGDGPEPAQLVAGGSFTFAGGVSMNRIGRWDGSRWLPFGLGMDQAVLALTTWDPDGPGPQPDQLIAGGSFSNSGGVTSNNIALWNGSEWQPLGTGVDGARDVLALTTWDPDGPGPLHDQLVAGGRFESVSGLAVNFIAIWDGIDWRPLLGGTSDEVSALTTWDPDGPGPAHDQLIAVGRFVVAGGVEVNGAARWDGSEWHALGSGLGASGFTPEVSAVMTWDPDGNGPLHDQLVVGGSFSTAGGLPADAIARWDGSQWLPVGAGVSNFVFALTAWDPDGSGPRADELAVAGSFETAGGVTVNRIASWNGTQWLPLGPGKGAPVRAVATVDPDGAGPASGELFAAGEFTSIAGARFNHIARWDGSQWSPLASGTDEWVQALTAWDPDGNGPQPEQLVAGGFFTSAGGVAADRIARWDGSQWHALGSGIDGNAVDVLTTWDPDGPGPQADQIIAAGDFTSAGGTPANSIARWDGSQWHPLSPEFSPFFVRALISWDPDGPGPQTEQLIVGGLFNSAGGATVNNIARWDGSQWHPLADGLLGAVFALTTWDPDGPGPAHEQLVAGGTFRSSSGPPLNYIARWDGSQWLPFGTGMNSNVRALSAWDPDASGPEPAQLVAGGDFIFAGSTFAVCIARWDGSQWLDLGQGAGGAVFALTAWDSDATGPGADQIVAGGAFTTAGAIPAGYIASWGCPPAPSCPGDWDGDGVVDFNDFLAFLNDFNLQDPRADINQDGAIDFNDLLAFLNFFNTPCP